MPRATPAMSFALFAALAGFALTAFAPGVLNDADTYWHIRTGEWMIAHRTILHTDPFSYTSAGAPWHTAEWLSEVTMAWAWHAGWAGLHLLFATAAALTAGIVGYFVRRRAALFPSLLTVTLCLCCVTGGLLARPHLLALAPLAIWTAGLVAACEEDRAPHWWLVLVMPLWVNLHGSFAFRLALAGVLAVEAVMEAKDRETAALHGGFFLATATTSALLSPFGIEGLVFPFRLTAMHGIAYIGEW